jgi:UDP-hydrolysing UDP-N-acetyl-D-glucosamine 2-epimerase
LSKRRIALVVTARPSWSRIKTAADALKARDDVDLLIVAAASALLERYGAVVRDIRAEGFHVAEEIWSVYEGETRLTAAKETGALLSELAGAFSRLGPDAVIVVADRHEVLAAAQAAAYLHIPLIHVQGGEVTGSIDDKVRNAITQLADVHLVSTAKAFDRVLEMRPDVGALDIRQTGCPSIDLAAQAMRLGKLQAWAPYVVVLQHPVTGETEQAGAQMDETIKAVSRLGLSPHYWWPGQDAGAADMVKVMRAYGLGNAATKNVPPVEFLRELIGAACVVGNSSVGIRECSYLGVPVVNIGTRQQGRERADNVIDVGHDAGAIERAIRDQIAHGPYASSTLYGDGEAGKYIAEIVAMQDEAVAA